MSIAEQDVDVEPLEAAPVEADSVLDHLHARHEQLKAESTPELLREVPGWRGALAVRYRYPDVGSAPIVKAFERAQSSTDPEAVLHGNADVLVACCHEIVGRKPEGDWESLETDSDPDRPVRFNRRLAELLQLPLPPVLPGERERSPGRFIVRNVFSPRAEMTGIYDGDVSLMMQAGNVIQWLQDGAVAAAEGLMGE